VRTIESVRKGPKLKAREEEREIKKTKNWKKKKTEELQKKDYTSTVFQKEKESAWGEGSRKRTEN